MRMEYCKTVYQRYHKVSKESKARILDELCKVFGYNRKYAISKLNSMGEQKKPQVHQKRKRKKLRELLRPPSQNLQPLLGRDHQSTHQRSRPVFHLHQ